MKTRFFISVLAGILLCLGYPPFSFYLAPLMGCFLFLFALSKAVCCRETLTIGGLFGLVVSVMAYGWMTSFAQLAGAWSLVLFLMFVIYQTSFHMMFSWVFDRLRKRWSCTQALLLAPFVWTLLEYLGTFGTFGLQELVGHTQLYNPLLHTGASVLGVNYLTFLSVNLGILPLLMMQAHSQINVIKKILIILFLASLLLTNQFIHRVQGENRLKEGGASVSVALVQYAIPKPWFQNPDREELIYQAYLDASLPVQAKVVDLMIWPEMVFPDFANRKSRWMYTLDNRTTDYAGELLFGGPSLEEGEHFNAAFLYAGQKIWGSYQKERLFPYGEKIPEDSFFRFFKGLLPEKLRRDSFVNGRRIKPLTSRYGLLGTTICLESLFTGLARARTDQGANILINLTNDAWFMNSSAAEKHFFVGAMRALENGRYFLQSSLYGVTGIVDPEGHVIQRTGPDENKTLYADVVFYKTKTLFTCMGILRFPIFLLITGLYLLIYCLRFKSSPPPQKK